MAKQTVSGIERNVEKIMVGVTGAILVGAIMMYLVESPRTAAVQGQERGPGQVDPAVQQIAQQLKTHLQTAKHEEEELEDPVKKLNQQSENPLGTLPPTLRSPLAWSRRTIAEVTESSEPTKVKLAVAVPPEGIAVSKGRTTIRPITPVDVSENPSEGDEEPEDRFWVTVAGEFDPDKQKQAFDRNRYLSQRSEVQVVQVLLHRQQWLPEGQWGDWGEIQPFSPFKPVTPPPVKLDETKDGMTFSKETRADLEKTMELIRTQQDRIARPLSPTKVEGDRWLPPDLEHVDVASMIQSVGKDASKGEQAEKEEKKATPLKLSDAKDVEAVKKQLEGLSKAGRHAEAAELADQYLTKAEQLPRAQARSAAFELKRFIRNETRKAEKNVPATGEEARKEPGNRIAIWAYDITGTPGETYRYRLGVRLLNGYVGVPHLLADPKDAAQMTIQSEWSAPSEPVIIPEDTRFYLTRVSGPDEASVEVWKWRRGQWRSEKFNVTVGEMIGEKKKDRTLDLDVDYSTNATVVQIEEDRKVPLTSMTYPEASFKSIEEVESGTMIFMEGSGRLGERIQKLDAKDPWPRNRKKELKPTPRTRG